MSIMLEMWYTPMRGMLSAEGGTVSVTINSSRKKAPNIPTPERVNNGLTILTSRVSSQSNVFGSVHLLVHPSVCEHNCLAHDNDKDNGP